MNFGREHVRSVRKRGFDEEALLPLLRTQADQSNLLFSRGCPGGAFPVFAGSHGSCSGWRDSLAISVFRNTFENFS